MAQRVHQLTFATAVCAAGLAIGACSNNGSAGVDAVPLAAAGSVDLASPTPTPSRTAAGGSTTSVAGGSTGVPSPTGSNDNLAMLSPRAGASSLAGINITPRLALNECLDILDAKPSTALPLQLYYCNGIPAAQEWLYIGGQLQIDGKWCLDVSSADPNRATNAILNACDATGGRPGQIWNLVDGMLQVAGTNVCLSVPDAAAGISKYILMGACDPGNPQQQWAVDNYTSSGAIGVSIANKSNQAACLDVYASRTSAGAVVDMYACNTSGAQQWIWQSRMLEALGQCLEAGNTTVSMQPCDSSNRNQQWVTDQGRLKLFNSERCLDLDNNNSADQAPLAINACSTAASQQWVWGSTAPAAP